MATQNKSEIALRLLRKMGLVGAGQTASADDQAIAEEKVSAVHDALVSLGKPRWTLAAVPEYAAEGYALMGTVLAGPDFGAPVDGGAWLAGLRMISAGAALGPSSDPVTSESF